MLFINPSIINTVAVIMVDNIMIDIVLLLILTALDQSVKTGGNTKSKSAVIVLISKTQQTKGGVAVVIARQDKILNPVFKNLLVRVYFIMTINAKGISMVNRAIGRYIEHTQLLSEWV